MSGRNILFLIFILLSFRVFSQWVQTNGPQGGQILSLCAGDLKVFAGSASGVWLSADSGVTWAQINGNLPTCKITAILSGGNNVWAGTNGLGLFRSSDDGTQWTQINSGLTNFLITSLAAENELIYAGTGGGLFCSTDAGEHWEMEGGILTGKNISAVIITPSSLIAGTCGEGIFRSDDNGATWQKSNTGITDNFISSLASFNNSIAAGTEGGKVFISSDNGVTWQNSSDGLPVNFPVNSLLFSGTELFAGTGGQGVFRSSGSGASWSAKNSYLYDPFINSLLFSGSRIFAATNGGGVFASEDQGAAWQPLNEGLIGTSVKVMKMNESQLMAGTSGAGFFISSNNGNNWYSRNNGISNRYISAITIFGEKWFVGTSGSGLYVSENQGIIWLPVGNGITNQYISSVCLSGSTLFASTSGSGIFKSDDYANTWTATSAGITDPIVTSTAVSGQKIYAGTQSSGVFISTDNGNSWSEFNQGLTNLTITFLAANEQTLFCGTSAGLYQVPVSGMDWVKPLNEGKAIMARSVIFFGNAIFAGTDQNEILLSSDNGYTWESLNIGLSGGPILSLTSTMTNLYAGTAGTGVLKRPMSSMFTNKINPDTVVLMQIQDYSDTIWIQSHFSWLVQGHIPDWFSLDKLTGSGNDQIIVRTLKPNLGFLPRSATLYLFSSVAPVITFTVIQSGRTAGLDNHHSPGHIRMRAGSGHGMLEISAETEIRQLAIYNIPGNLIRKINVDARAVSINLISLAKGIYILEISGNGWSQFRKYER